MLDIHNHILPNMDDGSRDWEESLAMARIAVDDGIKGVVCTPHWVFGYFENTRDSVIEQVHLFQERLEEHKIPLTLYPGSELRLDFELPSKLAAKEILTLNDTGRYALIELHEYIVPQNMERFFWELQAQNIIPILSHPERNYALLREPERLYKWVAAGTLIQITAASLLGRFGTEIRYFAERMVEHRLVHVVASDAHWAHMRTPKLSEGYQAVEAMADQDTARQLFYETPRRIVAGEPVSPPDPLPFERTSSGPLKRLFSFFNWCR